MDLLLFFFFWIRKTDLDFDFGDLINDINANWFSDFLHNISNHMSFSLPQPVSNLLRYRLQIVKLRDLFLDFEFALKKHFTIFQNGLRYAAAVFSKISYFLEQIPVEDKGMKNKLDSKLQTYFICSIRIRSRK